MSHKFLEASDFPITVKHFHENPYNIFRNAVIRINSYRYFLYACAILTEIMIGSSLLYSLILEDYTALIAYTPTALLCQTPIGFVLFIPTFARNLHDQVPIMSYNFWTVECAESNTNRVENYYKQDIKSIKIFFCGCTLYAAIHIYPSDVNAHLLSPLYFFKSNEVLYYFCYCFLIFIVLMNFLGVASAYFLTVYMISSWNVQLVILRHYLHGNVQRTDEQGEDFQIKIYQKLRSIAELLRNIYRSKKDIYDTSCRITLFTYFIGGLQISSSLIYFNYDSAHAINWISIMLVLFTLVIGLKISNIVQEYIDQIENLRIALTFCPWFKYDRKNKLMHQNLLQILSSNILLINCYGLLPPPSRALLLKGLKFHYSISTVFGYRT